MKKMLLIGGCILTVQLSLYALGSDSHQGKKMQIQELSSEDLERMKKTDAILRLKYELYKRKRDNAHSGCTKFTGWADGEMKTGYHARAQIFKLDALRLCSQRDKYQDKLDELEIEIIEKLGMHPTWYAN